MPTIAFSYVYYVVPASSLVALKGWDDRGWQSELWCRVHQFKEDWQVVASLSKKTHLQTGICERGLALTEENNLWIQTLSLEIRKSQVLKSINPGRMLMWQIRTGSYLSMHLQLQDLSCSPQAPQETGWYYPNHDCWSGRTRIEAKLPPYPAAVSINLPASTKLGQAKERLVTHNHAVYKTYGPRAVSCLNSEIQMW